MSFIITPLRYVIDFIYGFTGNYAVAIILFTLVVKLILMPLDLKQRTAMRKMTDLNPKLEEINRKYEKDPEKKNMKTMELYKKEKVNPLSGCLPVLIQFPILIAMFSVMRHIADEQYVSMFLTVYQNGVDAFQPESFLWIRNIWQPDNITASVIPLFQSVSAIREIAGNPIVTAENIALMQANYETVMQPVIDKFNTGVANGWAILPILAGASQFFQSKYLTPAPAQTSQSGKPNTSKMMQYIFPLMSVFFCWSYNAGFALYWVTSNLYAIAQYYIFNLVFDYKEKKKALKTQTEGEAKK